MSSVVIPFTVDEIDRLREAVANMDTIGRGELLDKLARWRELQVKRDLVNARADD